VPTNKHCRLEGLFRCGPVLEKEEGNDPEDGVDQVLLLGVWVIYWLNIASDMATTTAYAMYLKDNSWPAQLLAFLPSSSQYVYDLSYYPVLSPPL
jgi:hypothetical protein